MSETARAEADSGAEIFRELAREAIPHLRAQHGFGTAEVAADRELRAAAPGGSLPYDLLNEQDFERLCFHILLAQGGNPRFWGRRGDRQHGIDLIISDGDVGTVYQCKHYAAFGSGELKKALGVFRRDWLNGQPKLGRPRTFVLCTSASIKATVDWQDAKDTFCRDTGVAVADWHRDMLDGWLRDLPGVVADLFGDRVAELFCGRGRDWDLGLFRPLVRGTEGQRVDRYLELRDAGRIVRHPDDEAAFERILGEERQSVVLLGGLAGTGKTMAALDLASAFAGGSWRVFYLRPAATHDVDHLFAGIRDRAFRPAIFVLDDCHLAFDRVEALVDRLTALGDQRIKLVLTARIPPEGLGLLDPSGADFVELLRLGGQVIDIVADESRYRAIIAVRKPAWQAPPIEQLMAWSGRDLAILDLVLDAIEPADLHDVTRLQDLFPAMLRMFFEGAATVRAPNLKQLAAIAQFDVPVPLEAFAEPLEPAPRNAAAVARFVVMSGRPAALGFQHSSIAELVFRLLAWADGEPDPDAAGARECVEVLLRCAEQRNPAYALDDLLRLILRSRLKLADDGAMKRALLSNPRIVAMVEGVPAAMSAQMLSLATFICRDVDKPLPYASGFAEYLEGVVNEPTAVAGIGLMGVHLRTLGLANAAAQSALEARAGVAKMKALIVGRGTLVDLLGILRYSTGGFAAELLRAFNADDLAALTERMGPEKSIGTLNLALRDLGGRPLADDPKRTQLHLFEELLGAARLQALIARRGTLVELLRVLQRSTDGFAAELLQAFNAEALGALIERMGPEKSIGTLSLALRELGGRPLVDDPQRTQLHLFEERLGVARLQALIAQRGTFVDLLMILKHSTDGFAAELLRAFNAEALGALIERMGPEKSIGTLSLALRELGGRPLADDSKRTQLHLFEERLGAARLTALIAERGTLVELLKILEHSTAGFAAKLLQAFNAEALGALIERVGPEKSIGTLSLALRELGGRPLSDEPERTQLHLFEERLGAVRLQALIAERGTLVELLMILKNSTDDFAAELLLAFDAEALAALIERMDPEKSIGTLDLALRELGGRPLVDDPERTQLHLFEERLGAARLTALITERGTLAELLRALQRSTDGFAAELLRAFDAEALAGLVERMGPEKSIGTLSLALLELGRRQLVDDPKRTQLHLFEERLGAEAFWRLVLSAGNLNHLSYLLAALSGGFRATVLAQQHAPDVDGWCALARSGSFYDPARFARDSLGFLPAATAACFRAAIETTIDELVEKSTWGSIGAGLAASEKVADEGLRVTLVAAARRRIDAIDVDGLEFADFEAATETLGVLWEHREDLRSALGAELWRLLPNELQWPKTYKLLIHARFPLAIARSEHVAEPDALRVLGALAPLKPGVAISSKSARYHALFLWNLYALWFARGRGVAQEFNGLQQEGTWERFVGVVEKRRGWRRNEDKIDTLQLAGALAFLVPALQPRLVALLRGKMVGIRYLANMVDAELNFIPAFLACQGMAFCAPQQAIFTAERIDGLLAKAAAYDEAGPAIEHVCAWLRREREAQMASQVRELQRRWSPGKKRRR